MARAISLDGLPKASVNRITDETELHEKRRMRQEQIRRWHEKLAQMRGATTPVAWVPIPQAPVPTTLPCGDDTPASSDLMRCTCGKSLASHEPSAIEAWMQRVRNKGRGKRWGGK